MIQLRKGSSRQTDCHIITLGQHEFYFSYETCVGYAGPSGSCRRDNEWGPTTGRHIKEMGIKDWPVVTKERLDRIADIGLKISA